MYSFDVKEIGRIAFKGIIAVVPNIGGALNSVLSDLEAIQTKKKQERLEEFYLSLKDDVENLKEDLNYIYIKNSDFIDVFELTAKCIINECIKEKRTYFKNVLINSIVKNDCSYSKTENYLKLLEQMNEMELLLLKFIENPVGVIRKHNNVVDKFKINSCKSIITSDVSRVYYYAELLYDYFDVSVDDVVSCLNYLEFNCLIDKTFAMYSLQRDGHYVCTKGNEITSKGRDFISFILR